METYIIFDGYNGKSLHEINRIPVFAELLKSEMGKRDVDHKRIPGYLYQNLTVFLHRFRKVINIKKFISYISFFIAFFLLVQFTKAVDNKDDLSNICRVDYEGVSRDEAPQIQIIPSIGSIYKRIDFDKRHNDCLQLEGNSSQPISIINVKGDLVAPGKGVLLSMWIRGESVFDSNEVHISLQSIDQTGKIKTKIIGMSRLSGTKWIWLAAWYYREKDTTSAQSLILEIPPKKKVYIDDILMTYTPERLPEDQRPMLSVDEDKIMAGNKQIILQGVNISAYSAENLDTLGHELTSTREDDYRDIAAAGFNIVRLNLWYKGLVETGGWEWLDIHRLWARRHGLRLILDLHAPPGGYQSPIYEGDFWKDKQESKKWRDQTLQFWKEAASRYHDDPTIAAFNLINEPKPLYDAQWWAFVRKAVKVVRAEGFQQPITVESSSAKDSKFELLADKGIIYDYHFYEPWFFASGESGSYNTACLPDEKGVVLNKDWLLRSLKEGVLDFVQEHKVPLNIGEYGIVYKVLERGGDLWLQDLTDILDKYHISRQLWCWHTYGVFAMDRSGWDRHNPPAINKRVFSIISVNRRRMKQVAETKGLVAFWDFESSRDGAWTSYYDTQVIDHGFPVYLKHIGDTVSYLHNSWPYDDQDSRLQFDRSGPFGHAIHFNQGYIFGEVPRIAFDKTPLDIRDRNPFTIIVWVKFVGERHMVAGIWDEGGWNKYSGRRQAALFGGLFGDQKGVLAHISATGSASYPQSTAEGAQYARLRAIDGKSFENDQWIAMAMTFDPGRKQVTAYLNGTATQKYQTDPVARDVFRYEKEMLSNPFHFEWPIYSPWSFILKYNGYDVESTGVYEQWLNVDLKDRRVTYGMDFPANVKVNTPYRINLDIQRQGNSMLSRPLRFRAKVGKSKGLQGNNMILPEDILITTLEKRDQGKWKRVGSELRYVISEGAPFTFGRALGLESEVLDDGSQLFMDGVAVFNRILNEEELRNLSFFLHGY